MSLKPEYQLLGDRCRCMGCGEYFNSTHAFTEHRVGDFQNRGANRRCLSMSEMLQRNWSKKTALAYLSSDIHRRGPKVPVEVWITEKMAASTVAARARAEIS